MGEAALKIAHAASYDNLGTVEFLADDRGNFYFLEVNTRLQVEHPVTELVTGYDLVHLQLRIAAGEALPIQQQDIAWRGWALECRVGAEDPEANFFPSPGRITQLREPSGPGVRLDSGVYPGWTVPLEYDPLLAKLVTWAPDRATAIHRMSRALAEYAITGVKTTIGLFQEILDDPEFRSGNISTGFVPEFMAHRKPETTPDPELDLAVALAGAAFSQNGRSEQPRVEVPASRWLSEGRGQLLR